MLTCGRIVVRLGAVEFAQRGFSYSGYGAGDEVSAETGGGAVAVDVGATGVVCGGS